MLYKELISHLLLAFAIKRLEIEVDEIQTPAKDGLKHALKSLHFHKEINPEYEALKEYGIELISINVDESQALWRKTSIEDKIPWPDLYAGRASTILARYQVRGFPAKIVYDRNRTFIDIHFNNKHELLDWAKKGMDDK